MSDPPVSYTDGFNQQLRPLLDKYDEIRHYLEDDPDLHATSIVVIGDQSSGKSSVLESLVQIGLPRGENIVTRMPIILQCRCLKENTTEKPHAKVSISSPNDERSFNVEDFSKLEETIQRCQDTVMNAEIVRNTSTDDDYSDDGEDRNRISETPIYVQIVKQGIPDVTLIDLPGINYTNETIKRQIGAMYTRYIKPSNVIILNVISAVTDIKANESVLFAKKADASEERTIFVLTKVDRCQRNDVLAKVRELKGPGSRFVFVRNRNPDEIEQNIPWREVREKERVCLSELSDVDASYKGVPALGSMLVREGYKMILLSLDQLLDDIPLTLKKLRGQLKALGDPCESVVEKKCYFDDITHKMSPRLQQLLDGFSNSGDHSHILLNSNIQKFLKKFEEKFAKGSEMIFSPKFRKTLLQCLDDTEGLTLPNFLSSPVFKAMFSRLLKDSHVYRFITHDVMFGNSHSGDRESGSQSDEDAETSDYVEGIVPYINSVLAELISEALLGKPIDGRFGKNLRGDVQELIRNIGGETAGTLKKIVDAELKAGPFTSDMHYMDNVTKVQSQIDQLKTEYRFTGLQAPAFGTVVKAQETIRSKTVSIGDGVELPFEKVEFLLKDNANSKETSVFYMQSSLFAYWSIVRKRLRDHAHLIIMNSLCGHLRMWEEFMDNLWRKKSSEYIRLLVEKPEVVLKRENLKKRIERLEEANKTLNSIIIPS